MTIQTDGINKDSYGNKEIQEGRLVYAADAEASDTYVISLQPAATEMVTGMVVNFYCTTANTGAATLNINGLGAKTIKKNHDQDLATGDIEAGQIVTVVYDGTNFQMQSQAAAMNFASVDIDGGTIDGTTIGGTTPAAGSFTTLKMTTGAAAGVVVSDGSGNLVADTTPALGTPSSGTMDNTTTATVADNTSTTALASTAYAKSQDAVLAREPDQGVAMTAAASGSSGITVADNAVFRPENKNFTLVWKGSLPDWTPSAEQMLLYKFSGDGYYVRIDTAGKVDVYLNGSGAVNILSSVATGAVDGTVHEIAVTGTVGAVNTLLDYYLDGVALGTQQSTPNQGDISSATALFISGTNDVRTASTTHRALTFNRALTAAEVLDLYRNGVAEADKWGSQTSLNTAAIIAEPSSPYGTFSGASATGFHAEGDGTGTKAADTTDSISFVSGKKYRVSFTLDLISGTAPSWVLQDSFGGTIVGGSSVQLATVGANSYEFTSTVTMTALMVWYNDATATSYTVSNFSLTEIGATLALESSGIKTDKWYDSSSNALDGAYPTAGSSLTIPYQLGVESLLSVTNVSLAADADTTIYTVPTGRRLVLTKAILIVGADAGTTVISIGQDTAETDWLPNNTLSALDAANDVGVLMPVPSATTVLGKSYAAGTVIQAKVSSQAGGATNSLRLFGYLY